MATCEQCVDDVGQCETGMAWTRLMLAAPVKICVRCDKPIRPGQEYVAVDHHSASGAGTTVHVHPERCVPVLRQTYSRGPYDR
ncbi:hypothetical protein [Streptomyces sp. MUM 2J]|uniref:hypothetical protein n=1 Tax=Streptomyces sp. MUM 2J TaxID=2791987 RepID=UPI001F042C9F|nr:hypothetical protein [Streptomyces sp. MUM 2J]MCH0563725.1 hypothetical protein [Streptomyces sp. MUM 2J]